MSSPAYRRLWQPPRGTVRGTRWRDKDGRVYSPDAGVAPPEGRRFKCRLAADMEWPAVGEVVVLWAIRPASMRRSVVVLSHSFARPRQRSGWVVLDMQE
ncbi:MAG TPA: hypothetical protein VKD22_11405 [Ramlibacter sp.]|nr:hypothetical protein [Ramlibacter sp.]